MKTKLSKNRHLTTSSTFLLLAALLTTVSSGCQKPLSAQSSIAHTQIDPGIIGGAEVGTGGLYATTTVGLYNRAAASFCTASVLSESTLLTAAHCVDAAATDLVVVFATNFDQLNVPIRNVVDFKTSNLWPVRQTADQDNGDIAIVKFDGGLPAGYHAVEILNDNSELVKGAAVTLVGFGVTDNQTGAGAGQMRWVSTVIRNAHPTASEIEIEQSFGRGSCHGDSGGPAFLSVNGRLLQFGLTSRGSDDPDDTCKVAALYTNLLYYKNWIEKTESDFVQDGAKSPPAHQ